MARVLITGSSSGLGLDASLLLRERGDEVYGTVRSLGGENVRQLRDAGVVPVVLDVTDDVSVERGLGTALDDGPLDAVVNNAGIMAHAAVEETSDELAKRVFETNFFGPLRVIRAALPSFRVAGRGTIVSVSSTAGLLGLPGHGAYAASKQALEGMSESLYAEVAPLGITVRLIEPGRFPATSIEEKALSTARRFGSPYAEGLSAFWKAVGASNPGANASRNKLVAEAIWRAVHEPATAFRQPVGSDAELIASMLKTAPFEDLLASMRAAIEARTAE